MSKKYNIENYVSKKQLKSIKKVVNESAGDIDSSYHRIDIIMSNCKTIGLGTNRIIFAPKKKSKFVIKIAGDSHGVEANYREFYNADLDPKRLTNSYSISDDGYILIQERVKTMDERTMKKRKKDVRKMLSHLEDKLLLVDCKLSNFKNFGIRDNGDIVLLDHGDTLPLIEYNSGSNLNMADLSTVSLRCKCIKQGTQLTKNVRPCDGKLMYSENYDYFICKKCGMKTPINDAYKEFYAYARLADSNEAISDYNEGFDLKEYARQCNSELNNNLKEYADNKMKNASEIDKSVIDDSDIMIDDVECMNYGNTYIIPKPTSFTEKLLYSNLTQKAITVEAYCKAFDFEPIKYSDYIQNEESDDENIQQEDPYEDYEDDMIDEMCDDINDHDSDYDDADYDEDDNWEDKNHLVNNEEDVIEIDDDDEDDDIEDYDDEEDIDVDEFDDEEEKIVDIYPSGVMAANINIDEDDFKSTVDDDDEEDSYPDDYSAFIGELVDQFKRDDCKADEDWYSSAIMPYRSTPIQRYVKVDAKEYNEAELGLELEFDNPTVMYSLNAAAKQHDDIYYSFFNCGYLYIALNEWTGRQIDCLYKDVIRYLISVYGCNVYERVIVPIADMKNLYSQMVCLQNMCGSYDNFINELETYVFLMSSTPDTYIIDLVRTPFEYIMRYRTSEDFTNLLDNHLQDLFDKYASNNYSQSLLYFTINELYDYVNEESLTEETLTKVKCRDIVYKFEKEVKKIYDVFINKDDKLDLTKFDKLATFDHEYFSNKSIAFSKFDKPFTRKTRDIYPRANFTNGSKELNVYIGYDLTKFYDTFMRMYINRVFLYLIYPMKRISDKYNINIFKFIAERVGEYHYDNAVTTEEILNEYKNFVKYVEENKFMYDHDNIYICKLSNIQKIMTNVIEDNVGKIRDDDAICGINISSIANTKSQTMTPGKTAKFFDSKGVDMEIADNY